MEAAGEATKKSSNKPLKLIAKFFQKGSSSSSNKNKPEVTQSAPPTAAILEPAGSATSPEINIPSILHTSLDSGGAMSATGSGSPPLDSVSQRGPDISDLVFVDTELEALHISRTDNPYLQVLSSQDNLDSGIDSSVIMSPDSISPTRSMAGTSKELSLSEIHSHLVRSPPPVTWPWPPTGTGSSDGVAGNAPGVRPGGGGGGASMSLSPRSNGTFSPDSSDGMMEIDLNLKPTRGYSPYNRSHSEEHILSPCRDLLKSEFSPVRGTTPELLAVSMTAGSGGGSYYGSSPYRDRDYDVRSERRMRPVGRTASFASGTRSQHFSGGTLGSGGGLGSTTASLRNYNPRVNRSSNFYYTMNYSQDDNLDDALLSPNRNQLSYQFGARASRKSVGGLSFSPQWQHQQQQQQQQPQQSGCNKAGFLASWRRSYRSRSKSSSSSAHHGFSRKQEDTKSMENLLDDSSSNRYSIKGFDGALHK